MINQLTFTRFLAASLIVLLHFGAFLKEKNIYFINAIWEHFNLGVSYFYVLSGFVMYTAYSNKNNLNLKSFYIKRFSRIYPLHILCLVFIISVNFFYISDYNIPKLAIGSHLVLIQSWIPRTVLTLNAPAWSISVEMFFYLLFPIFFALIKKYNFKIIFLSIVAFNIINQIIFNYYYFSEYYIGFKPDGYFLFYNPLLHLNSFLIGILFGYIYKKNTLKKSNYDKHIFLTLILLISFIFICKDIFIHNGFFAIPFGILIILISNNTGKITEIFNNKYLIYLGNISFALYLLQMPVFRFSSELFKYLNLNNKSVNFFISFSLLIIISSLVYNYFEKPIQKLINNYFKV